MSRPERAWAGHGGTARLRRGAGEAVEIARRPSSRGFRSGPRAVAVSMSRGPVASDDVSGCSHQPSSSRASPRLDSFTVIDGINEMIDSHDDQTARRTGARSAPASVPRQRAARTPMRPAHQAHVGAAGAPGERLAERHGEAFSLGREPAAAKGLSNVRKCSVRRRRFRRLGQYGQPLPGVYDGTGSTPTQCSHLNIIKDNNMPLTPPGTSRQHPSSRRLQTQGVRA